MARHTILRTMHDLGLAAWFGGSLMGAVGLNGAAARTSSDRDQEDTVAGQGWDLWGPVGAAAVGVHLVGAAGLVRADRRRLVLQEGARAMAVTKTALTVAAVAATAYTALQGRRVEENIPSVTAMVDTVVEAMPMEGGDVLVEHSTTERDVVIEAHGVDLDERDEARRSLHVLQWVVPALTGALVAVSALAGEQQKPGAVLRGVAATALHRIPGTT